MTDKEFKRLNRSQLIDVIYQYQLQVDTLTEENRELELKLADKRLRLSKAGSIADAALEINDCFRNAQKAAEQYLNEIKLIREEVEAERQKILEEAQMEASSIVNSAKKSQGNADSVIDKLLEEYRKKRSNSR